MVNAFKTVDKQPVPVVEADNNQFIQQLLEGSPGAAVTNPAVIGGVGAAVALDVLSGKTVERETLLTPRSGTPRRTSRPSRPTASPTATPPSARPSR